ncbi:MAG: thymidine phosphorylase, partial [Acidobacteriota bacterium]
KPMKLPESAASPSAAPLHMIDLIRKKRDGGRLNQREIEYLVGCASSQLAPLEQLAAWLMAAWIRGLARDEIRALTLAMRDSGERFSPARLGRKAVDKHSSGGVGDKTSFLVAPLAAACGLAVPMISGRALGHTGGTLDKLESIPGYRTDLDLKEFEAVLLKCGASIIGQTDELAPADRLLYALRDRTGTVENPGLICASILSKKLAAGLDALVLDVKSGSGAFLQRFEDTEFLAALMVATAEAAGTRTVALLTDMSQPLGYAAGNWIELVEAVDLLRGRRPPQSEDLRELSLLLAGWMVHLGGQADTPQAGYARAEHALIDGSALRIFFAMVEAHGGHPEVFENAAAVHHPGATRIVEAWQSGYIAEMDTTALGWAVQRTGAGREQPGEKVDPHAGILFHTRRGARVEKGQPFATLYATTAAQLAEPEAILKRATRFSQSPPPAAALVARIFTRAQAETYLETAGSGARGGKSGKATGS